MGKKKILIIDDEKELCVLMKKNLEFSGEYEVATASSGLEGLKKAEATKFDLVITDFRMPGMNGEEVLDALKAMKPYSPPVILFSIYHDDNQTITPEIESKADGLISKPFDDQKLHQLIKEVLAEGSSKK